MKLRTVVEEVLYKEATHWWYFRDIIINEHFIHEKTNKILFPSCNYLP